MGGLVASLGPRPPAPFLTSILFFVLTAPSLTVTYWRLIVFPESSPSHLRASRSFAPAALRMTTAPPFGREGEKPPSLSYFFRSRAACHPERARGTRASEGSAAPRLRRRCAVARDARARRRARRASEAPHSRGRVYVTSFDRHAQSTNTRASSQRRRAFLSEPPSRRTNPNGNDARPTLATMTT